MSDVQRTANIYKSTTSFSHVLGNLTVIVEDYIKDNMPANFFKQSRATTEVAFKDMGRQGWRKNLIAFERPFLIIDPKFLPNEESEALPQLAWDRFLPIDHKNTPEFYAMNSEFFLKNEDPLFSLGYTFNRYKIAFRMVMVVDTQMMRLSLVNYLRSNFRFRHMFPITRYTETLIPYAYISHIAKQLNMDINSNDFIKKLNEMSVLPIVRLYRPATGYSEFFVLTTSVIQLKIPDYPTEDKTMNARVEDFSSVEFTMEAEVNVMNNFLLMTTEDVPSNPNDMINEYLIRICIESRTPAVDRIRNGMTLYTKVAVEFDKIQEVVDIRPFLGKDINEEIDYIQVNNLTEPYYEIVVYEWRNLLDMSDPDIIELDPDTFELKFKQAKIETVYTIFIYFDMSYMAMIAKYINADTIPWTAPQPKL